MHKKLISQIYHQESKTFDADFAVGKNVKTPEEWLTVFYKNYPRLKKIDLPIKEVDINLFEAIKNRSSKRGMAGGEISLAELGSLLKYSCGKTAEDANGFWRRAYPSAGARYPIEAYIISSETNKEIGSGIFHYNVRNNQLEKISARNFSLGDISQISQSKIIGQASLLILLTAAFWRTQNKYGTRGYRFILQESGHIAQNIYLISEALGLKCCALGIFTKITDEDMEKMLGIDGVSESLVYCLAIGK